MEVSQVHHGGFRAKGPAGKILLPSYCQMFKAIAGAERREQQVPPGPFRVPLN